MRRFMRSLPVIMVSLAVSAYTMRTGSTSEPESWIEVQELVDEAASQQDMDDLVEMFHRRQSESVRRLVSIVNDPNQDRLRRIAAVRMIGLLREPDATESLIEHMSLNPDFVRGSYDIMPCMAALVKIGKPASKAAVEHLKTEPDEIRHYLLCSVVRRVEGEAVGVFMLEQELSATTDDEVRRNLARAISSVRTGRLPVSATETHRFVLWVRWLEDELALPEEQRRKEEIDNLVNTLELVTGKKCGPDVKAWKGVLGAQIIKMWQEELARPDAERDKERIAAISRELTELTGRRAVEEDIEAWKAVLKEFEPPPEPKE